MITTAINEKNCYRIIQNTNIFLQSKFKKINLFIGQTEDVTCVKTNYILKSSYYYNTFKTRIVSFFYIKNVKKDVHCGYSSII